MIINIDLKEQKQIIAESEKFVKKYFKNESSGHDWWHSYRVCQLGKRIGKAEQGNLFIIELSALLHDVGDYKFHKGNEEKGIEIIENWLINLDLSQYYIDSILNVVSNISYMKSLRGNEKNLNNNREFMAVSDADRLDAIGAIGIARTFAFGGLFQRAIYDPEELPKELLTQEDYKNKKTSSINHFYEKLLKLKDTLYTRTGRDIAQYRHAFMEIFLKQFFNEWNGTD
jgi:uncharacterized protein